MAPAGCDVDILVLRENEFALGLCYDETSDAYEFSEASEREYMVYKLKAEWGSSKGGVRSTPFQIPAEYFHRPHRCYLSRYLAGFMLVVSQNLFRHDSVIPRTRNTRVSRSSRTLASNGESPVRSRLRCEARENRLTFVPLFKRSNDDSIQTRTSWWLNLDVEIYISTTCVTSFTRCSLRNTNIFRFIATLHIIFFLYQYFDRGKWYGFYLVYLLVRGKCCNILKICVCNKIIFKRDIFQILNEYENFYVKNG